mmetsp:Transcript_42128/g.30877  ORF Transcript_42128/g.30877 Transcript_42128/m.30877 type:complete len:106 (-) Transcript_42128:246-563(-)
MRFSDIICRFFSHNSKSKRTVRALAHLEKEMDVLEYLQNMRKLKFMFNALFSEDERYLEENSKWHSVREIWEETEPFHKHGAHEKNNALTRLLGRDNKKSKRLLR